MLNKFTQSSTKIIKDSSEYLNDIFQRILPDIQKGLEEELFKNIKILFEQKNRAEVQLYFLENELKNARNSVQNKNIQDIFASKIELSQLLHDIYASSSCLPSSISEFDEKWIGNKNWRLIYKATRDTFRSSSFHFNCDSKGATVTIIIARGGYAFGGYTPLSWDTSNKYVADPSCQSIIFTLTNPHKIPPTKYSLSNYEKAIHCHPYFSATFGAGQDICIANNSNQNTYSYSNFPYSYSDTTGVGRTTFTGSYNFMVREIEVFQVSKLNF
jgi:hypothetical protein